MKCVNMMLSWLRHEYKKRLACSYVLRERRPDEERNTQTNASYTPQSVEESGIRAGPAHKTDDTEHVIFPSSIPIT